MERGVKEKGLENAFQLCITPVTSHTAAVSIEHSDTPGKMRGQITQEHYKNAFNSSLSSEQKKIPLHKRC